MDNALKQHIVKNISRHHPFNVEEHQDELALLTEPRYLHKLLKALRDDTNCLFSILVSICGVDYPEKEERYLVVYNLLSLKANARVRVKVPLKAKQEICSVTDLYNSAHWYEREAFDMYGIKFAGNDDLRRILTDYGFTHHPLRKDFPLTGYEEVRYDLEKQEVVYEPVKLDQEFRDFDFLSPWSGDIALPGDEKAEVKEG